MKASASHWLLGALLALTCALSGASASAHRGHAVWTDISWTGDRFEITHRMHLADAIAINRFAGGDDDIEALRSLALVALYVEARFTLLNTSDTTALTTQPKTIGAEIEDDFVFVYQEWEAPLPAVFPQIDNRILLDIEPAAQAFIHISGPGIDEEREREMRPHP